MADESARYQIRNKIGAGGMGTVFRAYDSEIQRDVAFKWLPAYFGDDPMLVERFKREARVIARLEHPHIVPIYDVGVREGRPFIIMRLLMGGTLAEQLKRDDYDLPAFMTTIEQVGSALTMAHGLNIIHRDIKPANILFDEQGTAFLSDFGIAKVLDGVTQLTGSGIIGTPAYMGPEQFRGQTIDGRTDQYALAAVVYEALTGRLPFEGNTVEVMYKHLHTDLPAIQDLEGKVPAKLNAVLNQALAKDPAERYPTIADFVADLKQKLHGRLALKPSLPLAVTTKFTNPTKQAEETQEKAPSGFADVPPTKPAEPEPTQPAEPINQDFTIVETGAGAVAQKTVVEHFAAQTAPPSPPTTPSSPPAPKQNRTTAIALGAVAVLAVLAFLIFVLPGLFGDDPPSANGNQVANNGDTTLAVAVESTETPLPTATEETAATDTPQPATATSTTAPTEEPSPTATEALPTETATMVAPTAVSNPIAMVNVASANLRQGPGTIYPVAGVAQEGEPLKIIATNRDASWYLIERENSEKAWIAASVVTVENDTALTSIEVAATIPPAPTLTPTNTPIPPTQPPANNSGGSSSGGSSGGGSSGGGSDGGGSDGGGGDPEPVYTAEAP